MIDDIEDNYPEYVEDVRGYAWDAWDVLPADVIRRHDAIQDASPTELTALDPAGLDDLDRWAYARASRAAGDVDGFLEAARLVLASKEDHRGLSYVDVHVSAIEALASAGHVDEASLHLATFRSRWPDDRRATRLAVWIAARGPDLDAAITDALSEAANDGDLLYEISEDLAAAGASAEALAVLAKAEGVATSEGRRALMLDIALLRDQLTVTE